MVELYPGSPWPVASRWVESKAWQGRFHEVVSGAAHDMSSVFNSAAGAATAAASAGMVGIFLLGSSQAFASVSASVEVVSFGWPLQFTGMDLYPSAHCIAVKTL